MKNGGNAVSLTAKTDYYPFGMPMPNRGFGTNSYRYAFQGQEKDSETGKEAFELRLWDGRIGRWLTVDPAGQYSSPYLGMGNNPINGVDPDGAFFEYDADGNKISDLGGTDTHFYHQANGDTKVVDALTNASFIINGGESLIRGYAQRGLEVNYKTIFNEWNNGSGPEKSLIYGEDHPMNEDLSFSYQVFKATEKFNKEGDGKTLSEGDFGIFGLIRAGNMTEQMVGKATTSIYSLGNKRVILMVDSKSISSWTAKWWDGDEVNIPRVDGLGPARSNTHQTYIFILTEKQLQDNHYLYDTLHDSDW